MTEARRYIVVQECSAGNDSVGSEWVETKSFPAHATIEEIWAWSQSLGSWAARGRLMLRPDHD